MTMVVNAQVSSLNIGDWEPTFYYWGDNWVDYWLDNCPAGRVWTGYMYRVGGMPEFARYCYTDSTLKVIGIAGVMDFDEHKMDRYTDMTDAYKNMNKEYFRLYETDSNGGMELLAEASWNGTTPRYLMCTQKGIGDIMTNFMPVYEVYFDSARTVHDSFYVSATSNNHYHHGFLPYVSTRLVTTKWEDIVYSPDPTITPGPLPKHFKRKMHFVDNENWDDRYHISDTNWHTFVKSHDGAGTSMSYNQIPDVNAFMFLFPIIDTSYHGEPLLPDDNCQAPTGLHNVYMQEGTAVFAWNSPASLWDLCIAPQGSTPEQGTITQCNNNVASITGLDTSLCYTAWVRTRCSASSFSHWSDSVDFCMNGGTVDVPSVVDSHTFLFPNPASDQVQVASSFRISTVEVYSLSGQLVSRVKADGISATLDTRSLPSGTYLVRITTNHGITVKKLVVE